jgi:hypothetical protein
MFVSDLQQVGGVVKSFKHVGKDALLKYMYIRNIQQLVTGA